MRGSSRRGRSTLAADTRHRRATRQRVARLTNTLKGAVACAPARTPRHAHACGRGPPGGGELGRRRTRAVHASARGTARQRCCAQSMLHGKMTPANLARDSSCSWTVHGRWDRDFPSSKEAAPDAQDTALLRGRARAAGAGRGLFARGSGRQCPAWAQAARLPRGGRRARPRAPASCAPPRAPRTLRRARDADRREQRDEEHHSRRPGVWLPLWRALPAHQQRAADRHGRR